MAERREKQYQAQNRGVYMFRLDSENVVDATMCGGPARYINHSCDPNCATQLVTINGELKIVVMACRPISKHEEVSYELQDDVLLNAQARLPLRNRRTKKVVVKHVPVYRNFFQIAKGYRKNW